MRAIVAALLMALVSMEANAELMKVTAYCPCVKCCGKSDGITASGEKASPGMVACNFLPFGTTVNIEGLGMYVVKDRGAKSLFGTVSKPIKHVDIYMESHVLARKFGSRRLDVQVVSK